MKRHLFSSLTMMIVTLFLIGCEKPASTDQITFENGEVELIEAAADAEEAIDGGLIFTTSGPWEALIEDNMAVRHWLTLSDMSGAEAGRYEVHIYLKSNITSKERKADLHIICGNTVANITVLQKAETDPSKAPKMVYKIVYNEEIKSGIPSRGSKSTSLVYDDSRRLIKMTETPTGETGTVLITNFDYSVSGEVKITNPGTSSKSKIVKIDGSNRATGIGENGQETYVYNAAGYLESVKTKFFSKEQILCKLLYDENALIGANWPGLNGTEGVTRQLQKDVLYPEKIANNVSIDPNFFINPALDQDGNESPRQLLYIAGLLGNTSPYLLQKALDDREFSDGQKDPIIHEMNATVEMDVVTSTYDARMFTIEYELGKEGEVVTAVCKRPFTKTTVTMQYTTGNDPVPSFMEDLGYQIIDRKSLHTEVEHGVDVFTWVFDYSNFD